MSSVTLCRHGDRLTVRAPAVHLAGWTEPKLHRLQPHSIRWLDAPKVRSLYTYIGDIDVLICERDPVAAHRRHMGVIGKPYSNVHRLGRPNLTGLHFVVTDVWYAAIDEDYRQAMAARVASEELGKWDEQLLYVMAREHFGLPAPASISIDPAEVGYRCQHGLHVSPNRDSWGQRRYAPNYWRWRRTSVARGLHRHPPEPSRELLARIDVASRPYRNGRVADCARQPRPSIAA